jgi:hypothetical protein
MKVMKAQVSQTIGVIIELDSMIHALTFVDQPIMMKPDLPLRPGCQRGC